jgi:hypothetical protein
MRKEMIRLKVAGRIVGLIGVLALASACSVSEPEAAPGGFVLRRAHAHNDYEHEHPLGDALSHGFGSVEADVWRLPGLGDALYVAHDLVDIRPGRTLRTLYLEPLAQRVADNGGWVYPNEAVTVQLLVDIKTEAEDTYAALSSVLDDYRDMLTCVVDGTLKQGAVTVVLSGNRPYATLQAQDDRCAFHDGRSGDLDSEAPASLMPLISENWTTLFDWRGEGGMPEAERARLIDYVTRAHATGRRVRFWSTPDEEGAARDAVWSALLGAGVDHLNTDDLAGLEAFLRAHDAP